MPYRGLAVSKPVFVAKTAAYSVLPEDDGKTFTTRGASSGTVTFTLPAVSRIAAGWSARFFAIGAAAMKIASEADKMVTFNDADADAIQIGTGSEIIGAGVNVEFDGTSFLVWLSTEETQTVTVTT